MIYLPSGRVGCGSLVFRQAVYPLGACRLPRDVLGEAGSGSTPCRPVHPGENLNDFNSYTTLCVNFRFFSTNYFFFTRTTGHVYTFSLKENITQRNANIRAFRTGLINLLVDLKFNWPASPPLWIVAYTYYIAIYTVSKFTSSTMSTLQHCWFVLL